MRYAGQVPELPDVTVYIEALTTHIAGRRLERTGELLRGLPDDPRVDEIRSFVALAGVALGQTGDALRATAAPIVSGVASGNVWMNTGRSSTASCASHTSPDPVAHARFWTR